MNKLRAQLGREKKRTYWRDKYMKRWITSVTRGDVDTLQWLIYLESDAYLRPHEQSDRLSTRGLIIGYIKNIVQLTTPMSSFHVSVGVSRLLYGYDTAETQRMYELVSERYLGVIPGKEGIRDGERAGTDPDSLRPGGRTHAGVFRIPG